VLDDRSVVHVSGGPGSGKSTLARAAVTAAEQRDMRPLLIRAPSGATDAGVLALASVARRLGGNAATRNGWSALRARTGELLRDHQASVVLVLDEPSSWQNAGGLFARRADEAIETLLGPAATWPAIVCDQGAASGAVALPNAAREDLTLATGWDLLADAASQLYTLPIATDLRTPLQQRLAAALIAWGQEPEHSDAHSLGSQLAKTLATRRHGAPLWGLWQRLALARVPLDAATMNALGAARLSGLATATLNVALLDGADRLHDVLRTIPEDRPPHPELVAAQRIDAHTLLFEHHYSRFEEEANADSPGAADHAAEALFHAGELEDETRLTLVSVDLVEQLDALGHRLGTIHKDHAGAVTAYRRALLADSADPHATHHLAFHLDAQGLERDEVDSRYARAVKVEPGQPAWHARRIAFLVDTARPSAARRAWAQAESALAEDRGDADLFATLHLPVAGSLLASGELSFCAYVLDGVPRYARNPQHRDLSMLLNGRLAGQDSGAFVPAPRSGSAWWEEGPARLPARDTAGRQLAAWLAGRVEGADDLGVDIHVARVEPAEGPQESGLLRISFEDLAERLLDAVDPRELAPGCFVEIGRYRRIDLEERTGIVVLAPSPVSMPIDVLPADRWQTDGPDGSPERRAA
jgi:hypothetical protein